MIELANGLDRLFQLLIVAQPAPHLGQPFAAQAELPRAPARIAHRENREPVPFTAPAFRASPGMVADGPLQQRAAQHLAGHRERSSSFRRAAMVRSRLILINETDSRPAVNSLLEYFSGEPRRRAPPPVGVGTKIVPSCSFRDAQLLSPAGARRSF